VIAFSGVSVMLATNGVKVLIPLPVAGIIGGAVAIFIAFRNNTSYSRWWEARTQWGNITNFSRIIARQVIANTDFAMSKLEVTPEEIKKFKNDFLMRQGLFAKLLVARLYNESFQDDIHHFTPQEQQFIRESLNPPNAVLILQSRSIKFAIDKKILGQFDNISFDASLSGLQHAQGACERIKNTPLLKQYHFFTRLFVFMFVFLLAFSLIPTLVNDLGVVMSVFVYVLISLIFVIMNTVGEVNENPFSGAVTDVPIKTIANSIERELLQLADGLAIPPQLKNPDGYQQ
jgi:putative membrane protein